ncbi:hypothetical protein CRUP_003753 [Coryphaenoides rupestris]|nr:hypothetical protein CRUP_003753 [Coryphaenoides rupestris]
MRLYHSVWSRDGALLECSWADDAAVVDRYRSLCREKSDEFSESQSASFAVDDRLFQGCLRNANDSISDVVGYTFFNLLKMNCFQLSYHVTCTERNWFGMCKATKTVLQAEVQSPTTYEPADPSACDTNATQATPPQIVTPHTRAPPVTSDPTSAYLTTSSGGPALVLVGTSTPVDGIDVSTDTSESSVPLTPASNSHLDPSARRYGLLNQDTRRTLYHCSCTNRCKTIVNGPALPQPETPIPDGDVDEWRHLLAMRLQVRRPSGYRVKRKHGAVRLRRLCERITRVKVHKRTL